MDIIINKEQKEKQQTINLSGDKNIVEESSKSIDTLSQQFTVTEFSNAYKIKEVSEVLPSYNPKSFFEQIYLYKKSIKIFYVCKYRKSMEKNTIR